MSGIVLVCLYGVCKYMYSFVLQIHAFFVLYQLKCFTALSSPHTGPPSAAIRGPGNHEDVWEGQSER